MDTNYARRITGGEELTLEQKKQIQEQQQVWTSFMSYNLVTTHLSRQLIQLYTDLIYLTTNLYTVLSS